MRTQVGDDVIAANKPAYTESLCNASPTCKMGTVAVWDHTEILA